MTRRVRILQVITAFSDDAPAQSATVLAKYLDRSRFDVRAVSLRRLTGAPSMTVAELARAGIPHESMQMGGFLDLTAVARLVRLMRRWRPDVVHSHAFRADVWCGLAGHIAGVPLIVNTIRNHDSQLFKMEYSFVVGRLATVASWMALRLADAVVAVSGGVADYLAVERRVPTEKIHVIRNGFDFERLVGHADGRAAVRAEFGWRDEDTVVGALAMLKARKGLSYLIQAAHQVVSASARVHFFIAGQGPDRTALEAEIARLGLQDRVHLLGQRGDALSLLEAADIFVLPSLFEGLPRSLLEAMALAKPVVVTDIGGSREVVRHRETGLIVDPRDASGLAGAIGRLIDSLALRQEYGEAGRRSVQERFDARRTAEAHEAVYSQPVRRPNR